MKTLSNVNVSGNNGRVYTSATIDPSAYTWSWNVGDMMSKEDKAALVEKILEDEDEFMPILKKYLVGYLDKVLENPEPLIKELIKEKDEKISELSKEVEDLKKEVEALKNVRSIPTPDVPLDPNPYYPDPWGTGGITWSGTLTSSYNAMNVANSTTSTTTV